MVAFATLTRAVYLPPPLIIYIPAATASPARIISDISYINSSLTAAAVQYSSQSSVDYLGDFLAMNLNKDAINFDMTVDSYQEKNVDVNITAQTLTGYSLNINMPEKLVDGDKSFTTISGAPKAGQNGYAVKVDGGEWHGKPFSVKGASGNLSATHQTTIGVGTAWPAAGTYTGRITYTLTSRI